MPYYAMDVDSRSALREVVLPLISLYSVVSCQIMWVVALIYVRAHGSAACVAERIGKSYKKGYCT